MASCLDIAMRGQSTHPQNQNRFASRCATHTHGGPGKGIPSSVSSRAGKPGSTGRYKGRRLHLPLSYHFFIPHPSRGIFHRGRALTILRAPGPCKKARFCNLGRKAPPPSTTDEAKAPEAGIDIQPRSHTCRSPTGLNQSLGFS